MLKQTPLYEEHKKLNAKFTEFGGWDMPVMYTSIIEEHNAVRTNTGIFDTAHMGTFIISGKNTGKFLDYVTISQMSNLPLYKARYSMLLNDEGGIKDDIIVYKFENYYMMVVNAGNLDKDFKWLNEHKISDVEIKNISSEICLLALQGPKSVELISNIIEEEVSDMKYFTVRDVKFKNISAKFAKIARTGYTGEDGFEIFVSNDVATLVWNKILQLGAKPCGLGCRDTLRLEAGMPLHGHEIDENITPLEAGFEKTIYWNNDFIGKKALDKNKIAKKSVAFICEGSIARNGNKVFLEDKEVGYVTSGTFSPTFKKAIGLALIDFNVDEKMPLKISIHNNLRNIKIVKKPFYRR
ncbi:MAG: glycine cleavage system aminomethyltransferase GcvT [Endomicrobiaceae bacterium]|nr:glycine cleavage system aminomethyltransferase GcvT [Endomicrobiaceae bacterium]